MHNTRGAPGLVLLLATALVASMIPVGASAPGDEGNAREQTSTGETTPYLVGFRDLPRGLDSGSTYQGEAVKRVDRPLDFAVVQVRNVDAFVQRAEADPNVEYVKYDDPNAYVTHGTPNDPRYGEQYGWERVNAPAAWDAGYGSTGPIVAIVDTGLDKAHEDFESSRILQGYDFANGDSDPEDRCGHGTHVAGTAAATTNNGVGVAGASRSTILPVKVLEKGGIFGSCSGSFSSVASGIRYAADQGADVISMSLGCDGCSDQATSDALEYAWNKGSLLVASAGNSGTCSDCVGFPAKHPRVMAVSATDSSDKQASFSSQGPEVEIAAPGKDILSTTPGNGYKKYSGTSMSAPHVSGAAVLALSTNGGLSNADLRNHLQSTAKDLGETGKDDVYGYGLLDMAALVSAAGGTTGSTNSAPTASFTYSCTDLACSFDGTGSSDTDGTISSYSWDFGDTATGNGSKVNHTYASGGTYRVTLTVTDDQGATGTTSKDVTVSDSTSSTSTLRVNDISFNTRVTGPWARATALVTIVDDSGPVSGASVTGTYTLPDASTKQVTATTGTDGVATLEEVSHRGSGTFKFCVDDVQKSGATYDPTKNTETCDTVAVSGSKGGGNQA